jgi:hypothetical protein
VFIIVFKPLDKDKNYHLEKFIFASVIISPFWFLLFYNNLSFIIDKNDSNSYKPVQKLVFKNNSDDNVKYRLYLYDYNNKWHYYYPQDFSFINYKCLLPLIDQKPHSTNNLLIKIPSNTKLLVERVLSNHKNNVMIFEIPDKTLYIYNDDFSFNNLKIAIIQNKELVLIISNLIALILSFFHLFKGHKMKIVSNLTKLLSIIFIFITTLFLINFTYLIFI